MEIEGKVEKVYERLFLVIDAPSGLNLAGVRGRYRLLSEKTGIDAKRWENAMRGLSKPTIPMLVSICDLLPEFASWILTGKEKEQFKVVNGMRYSKKWEEAGIVEEDLMPGGIYERGFTASTFDEAEQEERRILARDTRAETKR